MIGEMQATRLLQSDPMAFELQDRDDIHTYTPAELAKLPGSAGPDLVSLLVLVAFGRLRLAEAARMTWNEVFD